MIYLQIRQLERDSDSDTKTETHSAMIGRDGGKKSHRDLRKLWKTQIWDYFILVSFRKPGISKRNKSDKLTKK